MDWISQEVETEVDNSFLSPDIVKEKQTQGQLLTFCSQLRLRLLSTVTVTIRSGVTDCISGYATCVTGDYICYNRKPKMSSSRTHSTFKYLLGRTHLSRIHNIYPEPTGDVVSSSIQGTHSRFLTHSESGVRIVHGCIFHVFDYDYFEKKNGSGYSIRIVIT